MEGLFISPKFFAELANGGTPTVMEVINIVTSFQLTDGVPVMPLTQKLVA